MNRLKRIKRSIKTQRIKQQHGAKQGQEQEMQLKENKKNSCEKHPVTSYFHGF